MVDFTHHLLLYSIFFTVVYISSSLVLRAVLNVINISVLSISYLPPILALNISLLLIFKTTLDLNPIVIKPGFVLEAIYHYSLTG